MDIKDIKHCGEHYSYRYIHINQEIKYVKPRCDKTQKLIINKLKDFLSDNLNGSLLDKPVQCFGCHNFVRDMIKYINYLKYKWGNEQTKYEVERLTFSLIVKNNKLTLKGGKS